MRLKLTLAEFWSCSKHVAKANKPIKAIKAWCKQLKNCMNPSADLANVLFFIVTPQHIGVETFSDKQAQCLYCLYCYYMCVPVSRELKRVIYFLISLFWRQKNIEGCWRGNVINLEK